MSTVDEQTTGTVAPDGGDESKDLTGTPEQDGRNAEVAEVDETQKRLEELERFKSQALAEKQTLEELKRKVSDYESRANQPPTTDPRQNDAEKELEVVRKDLRNLERLAESEDEYTASVARTQLRSLRWHESSIRNMMEEMRLERLPETDRETAKGLLRSGKVTDIETAAEMVALKRRLAELEKAKGQETEKAEQAVARRDSAPSTATRSLTAAEMANRMIKQSDYKQRMESLSQEERLALYRKVQSGQVKIKDD